MDAALRALADPSRRRILAMVWTRDRTAGEIAEPFAMSRPAISQHLQVLREAGLVTVRTEGTRRWYRANERTLRSVREMLEAFWDDRLALLKEVAEEAEDTDRKERTR